MRPKDTVRGAVLSDALRAFALHVRALPGIRAPGATESLVEQIVESIRRIEYIECIHAGRLSLSRSDPSSPVFDPLRAASIYQRAGEVNEACWLVFLSVHFGKNRKAGWQLARDVYAGIGPTRRWSWDKIATDCDAFGAWLHASEAVLNPCGVVRFGNHRKYESLRPGPRGTAAVVRSYVAWVMPHGDHFGLINNAVESAGGNANNAFDRLYQSMDKVISFGRTARFDYLTMLGKLNLAPIEPGIPYLTNATGPLRGARLLFAGDPNAEVPERTLDGWVSELGRSLGARMQVMEDALCNWQKHPHRFVPFRG